MNPALDRNPISRATPTISANEMKFDTTDVTTCAHNAADRPIGMEWNRAKMPFCVSVKMRNAV